MTPRDVIKPPEFNIGILTDSVRKESILTLHVATSQSTYEIYFCKPDEAEHVAKIMYDGIIAAAKQAKRAESGLVLVQGGLSKNATRTPQQGGRKPRPRGPSPQGPRPA